MSKFFSAHAAERFKERYKSDDNVGRHMFWLKKQIDESLGVQFRYMNGRQKLWLCQALFMPVFVLFDEETDTIVTVYEPEQTLATLNPSEVSLYEVYVLDVERQKQEYISRTNEARKAKRLAEVKP